MFCSYYFVSTFFSSSDILFSPCSTLLMRLVSFWASLPLSLPLSFFLAVLRFELRTACCLLGRCSYHLIHFSSPFLRFSFTEFQLFFQNFSFISCISSLLHSVVYLYSFLIHSGVLFNFSDHSNHSLTSLFEISFTLLFIKSFIVELLTSGGDSLPLLSYYLCFYIGIYESVIKFLIGGFNILCPLSWSFHDV
jgi:hypothetical protein